MSGGRFGTSPRSLTVTDPGDLRLVGSGTPPDLWFRWMNLSKYALESDGLSRPFEDFVRALPRFPWWFVVFFGSTVRTIL